MAHQSSQDRVCKHCGITLDPRGAASHENRYCLANKDRIQREKANTVAANEALVNMLQHDIARDRAALEAALSGPAPVTSDTSAVVGRDYNAQDEPQDDNIGNEQFEDTIHHEHGDILGADAPTRDDIPVNSIRIIYHPAADQPPETFAFDEYCAAPTANPQNQDLRAIDKEPWIPFPTRLDFETAEVMLDAHMNHGQRERMISIIRQVQPSHDGDDGLSTDEFTLRNDSDLKRIWSLACDMRSTGFKKETISIEYKDGNREYKVWYHSLWDWCRELLLDKNLVSQFSWDAVKLTKFDGRRYVQHIDEPWTAKAWWEIQDRLPDYGSPFCLILYADKTRLSSFGTEKGYPVLARCANLPVAIRNGEGVGGGRLVGWLPILEEEALETGKKAFVNLKRTVWHEAFSVIIRSLEVHAKLGAKLTCGDGVERYIYPRILMISADYEEMCMVSLIRGVNSSFPCPTCLVPKEEIPNLSQEFPLRTTREMEQIWTDAQEMNSAESEKHLQSFGLRDVENTFWTFPDMDVYSAISWDRLHAYHGGLFSDHLLVEFKRIVGETDGRGAAVEIDGMLDKIPPWSGLNHFYSLQKTGEFADGTKFEDFSKVIIFASLNVFKRGNNNAGYALLKLIRSYLELDMHAALTVHSELTIAAGKQELIKFEGLLKEYRDLTADSTKTWTFPKAHTHQHMFRDIEYKGATRNYNTKPGEKANGKLKKFYQRHTNFKDVANQVLKVSAKDVVSTMIRSNIDLLDAAIQSQEDNMEEVETADEEQGGTALNLPLVMHGSAQAPCSFADIERLHSGDNAFQAFRVKLAKALAHKLKLARVYLRAADVVTPLYFLKAVFRSTVDWTLYPSIIRANPQFHGRPRYDFALIKTEISSEECCFVQVLYIFQITYDGESHHMALVIPFDVPRLPQNCTRDQDLRLTRVCPRRRADSVFISTDLIIRGALLVEDPMSAGAERLVVNFTDEDMWMRMKDLKLKAHVKFY